MSPASPVVLTPRRSRRVVRLWLPLSVLFLLLAPLALLAIPFLYLAPRPAGLSPAAAVIGLGRVLLSLRGTDVDVQTAEALVRVRIF